MVWGSECCPTRKAGRQTPSGLSHLESSHDQLPQKNHDLQRWDEMEAADAMVLHW